MGRTPVPSGHAEGLLAVARHQARVTAGPEEVRVAGADGVLVLDRQDRLIAPRVDGRHRA